MSNNRFIKIKDNNETRYKLMKVNVCSNCKTVYISNEQYIKINNRLSEYTLYLVRDMRLIKNKDNLKNANSESGKKYYEKIIEHFLINDDINTLKFINLLSNRIDYLETLDPTD